MVTGLTLLLGTTMLALLDAVYLFGGQPSSFLERLVEPFSWILLVTGGLLALLLFLDSSLVRLALGGWIAAISIELFLISRVTTSGYLVMTVLSYVVGAAIWALDRTTAPAEDATQNAT